MFTHGKLVIITDVAIPTTERLHKAIQQFEANSSSFGKALIAAIMSCIPPSAPMISAASSGR